MQVLPIDVTGVIAVVMGMMVVLIPIAGLTARFALKPIAEAVARMRDGQGSDRQLGLIEQRLSLLEQQLTGVELDVRRLEEYSEFDRELGGRAKPEALPAAERPTE
ncbi:MAG: hypothetical protein P8Y10_07475 [Gemmatimonadales bacterium]|jgi:hypothetical protein